MTDSPLRVDRDPTVRHPAWFVSQVGVAIGLCILGDSLMYSILPLEAEALGIGLPLVGLLLSANRLIRLVSNSWAGLVFERQGPRRPFLWATAVSVLTTLTYGMGWGVPVFLVARMAWGVAWSNLRQGGFVAVWVGVDAIKGRLTGLLWGLVRLGSALSVLAGGLLYDRFGYAVAVGVIAGATALSMPVAWYLPWRRSVQVAGVPHDQQPSAALPPTQPSHTGSTTVRFSAERFAFTDWRTILDTVPKRMLVLAGFVTLLVNGIVLSTTSLYLAGRMAGESAAVDGVIRLAGISIGVGTIAGLMLGTRWLSDMVLGPVFGYLSDRFGQPATGGVLAVVYGIGLFGVVTLPLGMAIACLLLVFICDGGLYVVLSAAASGAATRTERPHLFIGLYTTVADGGSAVGPLLAFSLAAAVGLPLLYQLGGLSVMIVVVTFWLQARRYGGV